MSNSSEPTHSTIVNKPSSELMLAFLSHPAKSYPTNTELHNETDTIPPRPDTDNILAFSSVAVSNDAIILPTPVTSLAPCPLQLVANIADLTDKLCFIQYTPGGTMLRRWYIVQIDPDASESSDTNYRVSGCYY